MTNDMQHTARKFEKLFIGGEWVPSTGTTYFESIFPHNGELTGITVAATREDIDKAVGAAREAFDSGVWSEKGPEDRQAVIARFLELYQRHAEELALLTTLENGSPIWFTTMLQTVVTLQTQAYLEAARATEWEHIVPTADGHYSMLRREPVGVVAAIIPWNAPQQSALVKIIPALLAGCTVVFKPSPEVALNCMMLADIFAEAGLPAGVLNFVPADRELSAYLVDHPAIDKIAFTGSTAAGVRIAAAAGAKMKRYSLELGGKSAAIILDEMTVITG